MESDWRIDAAAHDHQAMRNEVMWPSQRPLWQMPTVCYAYRHNQIRTALCGVASLLISRGDHRCSQRGRELNPVARCSEHWDDRPEQESLIFDTSVLELACAHAYVPVVHI